MKTPENEIPKTSKKKRYRDPLKQLERRREMMQLRHIAEALWGHLKSPFFVEAPSLIRMIRLHASGEYGVDWWGFSGRKKRYLTLKHSVEYALLC